MYNNGTNVTVNYKRINNVNTFYRKDTLVK